MGQLDSLLQELASEGTRESSGTFGIDDSRARELLAQFQLVDPYLYIVELLQAAHLMGASQIDVRCDADELWFEWDGESWTHDELSELGVTALRAGTHERALWHIAVAASALRKTQPRTLRLTSQGAHGGFVVDLLAGDDAGAQELSAEATTVRHQFYVRERFRMEHVVEFVEKFKLPLPEVRLLRKHARFSDVPILVNGESVHQGLALPDWAGPVHAFEHEGVRGVIGASLTARNATFHMVQNGALIRTIERPTKYAPLVAVIEDNGLKRDLSLGSFVQDERWDWLFGEVLGNEIRHALFEATRPLAREWPWWTEPLYMTLIQERNRAGGIAPLHSAELKLLGELKRAPLFRCIQPGPLEDREPGDKLSVEEIRQGLGRATILRVGEGWGTREGLIMRSTLEMKYVARFMGVTRKVRE